MGAPNLRVATIHDQEFIADQKTAPVDLGFVAETRPKTSLESLANQLQPSRRFQRLGSNCDAAVFAPGNTTTVVPIVTRL